jgi:predicted dinucleotide-binding enzyme
VVDITNPVNTETWDSLATPPGGSSAEEIQQLVPQGTPVCQGIQHDVRPGPGAGRGGRLPTGCVHHGDDDEAKQKVSQLVADAGLCPIDVGPLRRAQELEQLGFLHNVGFGSAIKLPS